MTEVKCKDCGCIYKPRDNEEIIEQEIYTVDNEKRTIKKPIPMCPKCGRKNYRPLSIPDGDPKNRRIALLESR